MKKYPEFDARKQREKRQQQCDALKLFQYLLRNSERMDELYAGKALAIAEGIQPWIDALEDTLAK